MFQLKNFTIIFLIFQLSELNGFYLYGSLDTVVDDNDVEDIQIILPIEFNPMIEDFPNDFQIKFVKYGQEIDKKFIKLEKNNNSYPISEKNIYVIDLNTGHPKLYDLNREIQIDHEFYTQSDNHNGIATLIIDTSHNQNNIKFKMFGTVFIDDDEKYVLDVLPINFNQINKKQNNHKIKKRSIFDSSENFVPFDIKDYIDKQENREVHSEYKYKKKRSIYGKPLELNVEVLVVADTTVYNDHMRFTGSSDQNVVFQHMKIYFSHVMFGANQRFYNSFLNDPDIMIYLKLTNFLFITNPSDLNWLDPSLVGDSTRQLYNGRQVLLASKVINSFATYMNSKSLPFEYDHAIGYFNKDLWSDDTSLDYASRSSVRGYSFIGQICNSNRYSIVEETGGFFSVLTTAHEIGHNLGALHDDGSNCPVTANYIMVLSPLYNYNPLNLLKFSSCSIERFKFTLLNSNGDASKQAQCLKNIPNNLPNEFVNAENQPTGLIWSPDDQCKMMFGDKSEFCRSMSGSICTALFCKISTNFTCQAYPGGAAEGTVCESGKICKKGVCTQDSRAPVGNCVLGENTISQDVVGVNLPYSEMKCQDVLDYADQIGQSPNVYCQDDRFSKLCCTTCIKYNKMSCTDDFIDCKKMKPYCKSAGLGSTPIYAVCKRSCEYNCQAKPITCSEAKSICQNGGTCFDTTISLNGYFAFKCSCLYGFYGEYCEKKNPCLPNPCLNNGICIEITSLSFICQCKNNCQGNNCNVCDQLSNFSGNQYSVSTTIKSTTSLGFEQMVYQDLSTTLSSSKSCLNMNDFTCNYFLVTLGLECNPFAFIGSISVVNFCQKSCNQCASLTTRSTSTINIFCYDTTTTCDQWKNYCYLLTKTNPHPCRKTCNLC